MAFSTHLSNNESGLYGLVAGLTPQPFEVYETGSPDILGGSMDIPVIGGLTGESPSTEPPVNNLAFDSRHTDLLPTGYPPSLPTPYIVEHLVDLFFSSVPLGNKVLCRSSFLESLKEPPTVRKFPATALLHAICAISSFVSPLVQVPKMPDLSVRNVYDDAFVSQSVLEEEHSFVSGGSITFSLEQAMLARATIETDVRTRRHRRFGSGTGLLILCWYYVSLSCPYPRETVPD